ncbi:hypothetical protein [Flavobacterium sp.]|uniref:hypothetical protein n=1 Tax=Flavobacterium sp. TaxID=239 RepID=UPI0039E55E54
MKNSSKGFRFALMALALFVCAFVFQMSMFHSGSATASSIFTVALIVVAVLSNVGLVYSIKEIRKARSVKTIIGLLVNLAFLFLYGLIIAANIADLLRAFQ